MSLSLNCCILGDARTFTVKIEKTDNVNILKKRIKEEKAFFFNGVDASDLEVWQVNIPVHGNFMETFEVFNPDGEPLSELDTLAEIFLDQLHAKHLHIVVQNRQVVGECDTPT
jgi:hypothetical protein